MPNPDISWDDPITKIPTTPGVAAPILQAVRECIIDDPNLEIHVEDGAAEGSKEWTSCKHVAGSPNPDCVYVFYCSAAAGPAAWSPGTSVAVNRFYSGVAPFGGGATMGNPKTDSAANLFTGGSAKNRAFYGLHLHSQNSGVHGPYTAAIRTISSDEALVLLTRGSTDLTCCWFYGGAIISPFIDGHGGTDDRIYGSWVPGRCGAGALESGIPTNFWSNYHQWNDAFLTTQDDEGTSGSRFVALDPSTETSWHWLQRFQRTMGANTQTSELDQQGAAAFNRVAVRRTQTPRRKIGYLRSVYPWKQDYSNQLITADSGAVIVGRTLGFTESSLNECLLLGRTV
jgi:hypothetical protein